MSAAPASPVAVPGWGVYTLANDAVLEWTLAMLASLREHAPGLPLLVIPYDDRQERLAAHLARLGHGYLEHPAIGALDALGHRFYPDSEFAARGFRKLASFEGPFARFLFLDSDALMLAPFDSLGAAAERSGADLVHFDTDVEQVYRPGPLRTGLLAAGRARGFNAGLFLGRRGALDARRFAAALADLDSDWQRLLVPNAEQPFLNLFADRAQWQLAAAHELLPDSCSTCWPRVGRLEADGACWRLRDSGRWDEGRLFRFAHWAGCRLEDGLPNAHVWHRYRERARTA